MNHALRRRSRPGNVFQGRYRAVSVDAASGLYFLTVSTYIHLNPARAKPLVRSTCGIGIDRVTELLDVLPSPNGTQL